MRTSSSAEALEFLLRECGDPIRLAAPLGVGKPNRFLNGLLERMRALPERRLELYTALSLDLPEPTGFLQARFQGPFADRHFGADYPWLSYVHDRRHVPPNVKVFEFYSQAGTALRDSAAQANYISLNYTHAASGIFDRGLQVIVQLVARDSAGRLSLGMNPDVTLDLDRLGKARGRRLLKIAFVHPEMPFLEGPAAVGEDFFDLLVEGEESYRLFAPPRRPVDDAAYAIGLHASSLVADGGTLQIGIGELGDGLAQSLILRHARNARYRELLADLGGEGFSAPLEPFAEGLFGLSEMVGDSLLRLRDAGVLRRHVRTPDGHRLFLQGAFALGSPWFYRKLAGLEPAERRGISMCPVSDVNDLYDPDESEVRRERKNARFFNAAMTVNLFGGASSDTLDNGKVVSGVGGQYNFVAMAHELSGARSVLMLRSTRTKQGRRSSNVHYPGGHLTIPRHLRDCVVTEYGVADLRARTDEECAEAMIEIADAQFQPELIAAARRAGKLNRSYRPSERALRNTPENLRARLRKAGRAELLPAYPFGSDFTPEEERLMAAFERLGRLGLPELAGALARGFAGRGGAAELARMELDRGRAPRTLFWRWLLRGALAVGEA